MRVACTTVSNARTCAHNGEVPRAPMFHPKSARALVVHPTYGGAWHAAARVARVRAGAPAARERERPLAVGQPALVAVGVGLRARHAAEACTAFARGGGAVHVPEREVTDEPCRVVRAKVDLEQPAPPLVGRLRTVEVASHRGEVRGVGGLGGGTRRFGHAVEPVREQPCYRRREGAKGGSIEGGTAERPGFESRRVSPRLLQRPASHRK